MPLNPTALNNLFVVVSAFGGAFTLALWVSIVIWVARDIKTRSHDGFARFLAILIVVIFFLPGLVLYWILRPRHTIEEEYQHSLEEEALLHTIEDLSQCPSCGRRIQEDWVVCPKCRADLKKSCGKCCKKINLAWEVCPYCGEACAVTSALDDTASITTGPSVPENTVSKGRFPVSSAE